MMIGYTAFRTMSSAKHIKDDYEREAVEISLQVFGMCTVSILRPK